MSKTYYVDHALTHTLVLPNSKMVLELLFSTLMQYLHLPPSYSHIPRYMKAFMAQEQRVPSSLQHIMQKVREDNPNYPLWPYVKA